MNTCFLYDECMTLHKAQYDHCESPDRIIGIYAGLNQLGLLRFKTRQATWNEISRAHSLEYCQRLKGLDGINKDMGQNDMFLNQHTIKAVLTAAGSTCQLVDAVLSSESVIDNGFAVVRPPGHHASHSDCSGFCYVNNVLVAAFRALAEDPSLKILIVDWDVHYHLGTSDIIQQTNYTSSQIVVYSIHRFDHCTFYPGHPEGATGSYHDGRIINTGFNMPRKSKHGPIPGDVEYNKALSKFLDSYQQMYGKPDIVIVSCGFDAAHGDPLGGFKVTPKGYYDMTRQLMHVANGKVAMVLEGGYNVPVITRSAVACAEALKTTL